MSWKLRNVEKCVEGIKRSDMHVIVSCFFCKITFSNDPEQTDSIINPSFT